MSTMNIPVFAGGKIDSVQKLFANESKLSAFETASEVDTADQLVTFGENQMNWPTSDNAEAKKIADLIVAARNGTAADQESLIAQYLLPILLATQSNITGTSPIDSSNLPSFTDPVAILLQQLFVYNVVDIAQGNYVHYWQLVKAGNASDLQSFLVQLSPNLVKPDKLAQNIIDQNWQAIWTSDGGPNLYSALW